MIWKYLYQAVIEYAEEVLAKTPEMLPVLKEAGVVDSGGQGLLEVLKGGYDAFQGKEIDYCCNYSKCISSAVQLKFAAEAIRQILNLGTVQSLSFLQIANLQRRTSRSLKHIWSLSVTLSYA